MKSVNKKTTVTVAIPAFNEEKNIDGILQSLLNQNTSSFHFQHILIYSEASTDLTHQKVRDWSKKNPIVKLKAGKTRKGKYLRMGDMFRENTSDVLIVLDADIVLKGTRFLEEIVKVIYKDSLAMMVAAHQVLLQPKTVIGKILHANFLLWDLVRWSVPNYDNANNFYGSATAFRGSFAKTIHVPSQLSDPHLYIYLLADKVKGFRYAQQAEILQQPISTWKDFNKFLDRTLGKKDEELEKMMGVNSETVHLIPWKYKMRGILKSFRLQPLYTIPALLLIVYMKLRPKKTDSTAIWQIVSSTKKPIQYVK